MKIKLSLLFVFAFCSVMSACHEEEVTDEEELNPYVDTPAYPILTQEGSLHLFKFSTFFEDSNDIRNDLMVLSFDNFNPATTNIEPDEDEIQTVNDLGWTQNSWDENTINWLTIAAPKAGVSFQKTRQYRKLKNNELSAPTTVLNQPTYEAIDENVYERQLGAIFVWDFGNYTDEAGKNVSGKEIGEFEIFFGFELLKHAAVWGHRLYFSTGATIYGATRSIAADSIIIDAVDNNGSFSLSKTKFGIGMADIESALDIHSPDAARLEYRFTVDYVSHNTIYMNFDTTENIAYLSNTSNGLVVFPVPYTVHDDLSYVEIDTSGLTESERIILGGLPNYFNPVIVGPFTEDGSSSENIADKAYYYGKHYIKTSEANRLSLQPVFFLNATAKNDVQNAFRQWRNERHIEEGI